MPFYMFGQAMNPIIRSDGSPKFAMVSTVAGAITNIFLDYTHKESFGFDFRPVSFRIDGAAFRQLLALGVPMAIQSGAINFSKIVLTSWINMFDVTYSALAGIFNKVNIMSGVISQSFTTAGSTMVGQNLGAKEYGRVNRIIASILSFTLGLATLMTLIMLLVPDVIYGVFTTDP